MNSSISRSDLISATKVKNYLLDDPLLDWLNLYGKQNNFLKNNLDNKFSNFLKDKGVEFEEYCGNIMSK